MNDILLIVVGISLLLSVIILGILITKISKSKNDPIKKEIIEELRLSRQESLNQIQTSIKGFTDVFSNTQSQVSQTQDKRLFELNEALTSRTDTLRKTVSEMVNSLDERFKSFSMQNEQKLENIRNTVEHKLKILQEDNSKQLEQMRLTVDEKLQKTLNERINQSFKIVSDRLEQVYKGLGEMQTLAAGVGDLKKVLSNVKTRGILGEIQLGAILEEILSPEQYAQNIATKPGSTCTVEFAIKLPGDENGFVYLPIDSKFPADAYTQLLDAYDSSDQAQINTAVSNLDKFIKLSAKTIRDKYIEPPYTTDFGIMFLPFEGLYAEVVRRGMIEKLQRDYKINIAGPTTMAAILNSLQMGFKTLTIQKRSSEVWKVLGAVKTEIDKFGDVLGATQMRLEQANRELDKLVGVRTRKIQSTLRKISTLSEVQAAAIIDAEEDPKELA